MDLVAFEEKKIKGAIRTDFILSAEIIVITLGVVADAEFVTRLAVLAGVALAITIGVYGVVAGIVKLDDLGLWLTEKTGAMARAVGRGILLAAPWLMRGLSVLGTIAMFLVGGGIVAHGIGPIHHAIEHWAQQADGLIGSLLPTVLNGVLGVIVGAVLVGIFTIVMKLLGKGEAHA